MQETMRDPAIERLSKIISETGSKGDGTGKNNQAPRRPSFHIHIGLDEGWFSLFLLATVVYSTIWSVQAAGWVDHLNILSLTTLLGLIIGVVAAKQQRFPRLLVHAVVGIFALLLAFWQTAGAYDGGNTGAFANGMHQWFVSIMAGGTGEDDSIFLFFIIALGFVLAYTSAWLVYRTRSPWLMIMANAVVLLINLSNIDAGYVVFLVVFLMASLLLLLRFNLHDSIKRWRRQGLRYADDLGWDVMQSGALISIGLLIFSWLLPWGYTNDTAAQIWNADANPWVQLQDTWNRIISFSGGNNPSNHGNFRDTLVLGGNPNLNNDLVFTVQGGETNQYLASISYETYDGRGWSNGSTSSLAVQTNESIPSESSIVHPMTQQITVVSPPGEQYQYLFGASQIAAVNQPVEVLESKADNSIVAIVLGNGNRLRAGESYAVTSYVSSADENSLRTVPMPADSPRFSESFDGQYPLSYYNPATLSTYTQLPKNLDPDIAALAHSLTDKQPTMYDKVLALENYLRTNFSYDVNIHLPSGEEGVSWFLFRSDHKGFCNYFATTMTVMARSLGIPARVVAGYTNGKSDDKNHRRDIYGTDAHSWTQVYFAGYGWVNFEPSAGFSSFTRPTPGQYLPSGSNSSNTGGVAVNRNAKNRRPANNDPTGREDGQQAQTPAQVDAQLGRQVGLSFGSLILLLLFALMLFSIWWRRLFRNYSIPIQIYGRICLLANWAGLPMRPAQTPHEYIRGLGLAAPEEAPTLERFADIYVRELWAAPGSPEHPKSSGEVKELPDLWKRLQPRLFLYLLRHPHVLRLLPAHAGKVMVKLRAQRRARRALDQDL